MIWRVVSLWTLQSSNGSVWVSSDAGETAKKKKKKKKKTEKKKKNKKQLFRIPCKRSFHRIPHQFQQAKSACIIDGELSFTKSRGLEGPQRNRMFVVSTAAMCLGNTEILSLFFMATRPKL